MATLTIRIPDDKAERLKLLAVRRGISVNKLFEEWATMGISEFDAESRFLARAVRGGRDHGIAMIAELNKRDNEPESARYSLHDKEHQPYDSGQ